MAAKNSSYLSYDNFIEKELNLLTCNKSKTPSFILNFNERMILNN